jgi:hypothetical protein
MPVFLPWVLDGAGVARTQALLGMLPEPVRRTYENEWRPAYSGQERWTAGDPATDRVKDAG